MTLERDDDLLTALAQGIRPDPDDPAIEMLAAWRADLDTAIPAPAPARRRHWYAKPIAIGFAAGALFLGGTTAMAATAGPGSPLWPITQAVYPQRAQSRTAEQAAQRHLDQAAQAIAEHRYNDALTALTDAARDINQVTDETVRHRLEQRWIELRTALIAATTVAPPAATGGQPSTAPPSHTGGPGSTPTPAPPPSPASSGKPLLPLPLPSLPLPLPSLPLPLPSLPPLLP